MRFFDNEDALRTSLDAFMSEHRTHLGLVSLEVPLISSLPVWGNIALIRQYHENMSWANSRTFVSDLLKRFDMTGIADRRTFLLKMEELFCVMLLRAATVRGAVVVLDRPFLLLPKDRDSQFIMDALRKIDDLIAEAYIFDYSRAIGLYRATDGTAD